MIVVVVVRTLAFLIVRRLLGLAGLGPGPDAKDVEIAGLRHQLAVVGRQGARPRYTPTDRLGRAWRAPLPPRPPRGGRPGPARPPPARPAAGVGRPRGLPAA